jgi:hypothetical protein
MTLNNLSGTEKIDLLNIGLIAVSFVLALLIPFPLFLFAYAVLGPLHYLTEISWLHDRSYFIREARAVKPFIAASIVVSAGILVGLFSPMFLPSVVYLLFGGALILAVIEKPSHREKVIVFLFMSAILFTVLQPPLYVMLFTLLIPTVVHVFFFTAAFMLSGALKSGSRLGLTGFVFLAVAGGSLLFLVPEWAYSPPSRYILDSYQPFSAVNATLMSLLASGERGTYLTAEEVFSSRLGQAVMQFLAFAYTYHYLNWFSKSRIIGWNQISTSRRSLILGGWIAAVAVYAYDYRVGVQFLFLLSFLHVLLEFPLNHRSFADIGQRITSALARQSTAPGPSA